MKLFKVCFLLLITTRVNAQAISDLFNKLIHDSKANYAYNYSLCVNELLKNPNAIILNEFLNIDSITAKEQQIINKRDSILYYYALNYEPLYALPKFITNCDNSEYQKIARKKLDGLVFDSYKIKYSENTLNNFVNEQPDNANVYLAYEQLWNLIQLKYTPYEALDYFLTKYPKAPIRRFLLKKHFTLFPYNHINDSLQVYANKMHETILQDTVIVQKKLNELICLSKQDELTKKWGYINEKNQWVILPQYIKANEFKCGLAVVETDTQFLIINKNNNLLYIVMADDVYDFEHGYATVVKENSELIVSKTFEGYFKLNYKYARTTKNKNTFIVQTKENQYYTINEQEDITSKYYSTPEELKKQENLLPDINWEYINELEKLDWCNAKINEVIDNRFVNFVHIDKKYWFDLKTKQIIK